MNRHLQHPLWRAVELAVLMVGLPLLLYWLLPPRTILLTLWLTALYCHIVYRTIVGADERLGWNASAVTAEALAPILLRFSLSACVLLAGTLLLKREMLLSFVLERPAFWALVMVLYPLISVVPQEIIFRVFFFRRYREFFPKRTMMVLASALTFGLAHIVFHNMVAPTLCVIGGYYFADTYARHRSLLLVAIEHALYGDFIFTLGLGHYFYHGTVATLAAAQ